MSNYLAIATVTRALGDLVEAAAKVAEPGAHVSYVRPGGTSPAPENPGVNIFLYGVTPNAALLNAALPTRRSNGAPARRTAVALDLHYLLTFYGSEVQFIPQRMLGSVATALAQEPMLGRDRIGDVSVGDLLGSNLADAPERVRFVPATLNLEELSKLWSVLFQTPYALSMVLQAGPVILEPDAAAAHPALPVHARNVYVDTLLGPRVEVVAAATDPGAPILPDTLLVLRGRGLRGEVTRVRLGVEGDEVEPVAVTPAEVMFPLSAVPPDRLRAGVQGAQVVHRRMIGTPPVPHRGEESNVAAFVLRPVVRPRAGNPALDDVTFTPGAAGPPVVLPRVTVRVTPQVGARQHAELLLNEVGGTGRGFRFTARSRLADGDTVDFDAPGLGAGAWLVRVVIDGAESVLAQGAGGVWERPRLVVP